MPKRKEKTKYKRMSLYLTEPLEVMLDALMKSRGDTYPTETIKEAIRESYRKSFPLWAGSRGANPTEPDREETLRRQMKDKDLKKQIKEQDKQDNQLRICNLLGGTVEGSACVYYKYDERDRYEQTVPLTFLTEDMVTGQYVPSKERVEQLRKKKLTNY